MVEFTLFLVLVSLLVPILYLADVWGQSRRTRKKTFADFAGRHGGRLLTGGPLGGKPIEATFSYCGLPGCIVDSPLGKTPGESLVEMRLFLHEVNTRGLRLDIYPEGSASLLAKRRGVFDLDTGDGEFDRLFVLESNDSESLGRLLDGPARSIILELYRYLHFPDIYIHVDRLWIRARKRVHLASPGQLDGFASLVFRLFHRVLCLLGSDALPDGHDEVFLMVEAAPAADQTAVCQVCGEDVSGPSVACAACGTVHHADCWEYNGRCSTYGCPSRSCIPHSPGGHGPEPAQNP